MIHAAVIGVLVAVDVVFVLYVLAPTPIGSEAADRQLGAMLIAGVLAGVLGGLAA